MICAIASSLPEISSGAERRRSIQIKHLHKKFADGGLLMNRTDATGEQFRDTQNRDLFQSAGGLGNGDRIGGHHFGNLGVFEAFNGRPGENGVSASSENLSGAFANQRVRCFHERASGVDNVVHDQGAAAFDVTDQVHHFGNILVHTALVHDGQRSVKFLGEGAGAFDAASVGGNHGEVRQVHLAEIFHQHGRTIEVIHGHVKITLNLRSVQVQSERAAGAGRFQEVGDELRGYRNTRFVLAVLTSIAVVRKDGGDAPGGSALESVNHQKQLQEVVVHRI